MTLEDDRHRYMSLAQVLQLSVRKQVRAETMFTEVVRRLVRTLLRTLPCVPALRAGPSRKLRLSAYYWTRRLKVSLMKRPLNCAP